MARINVEQQALTDFRIATLGHILGGDHRLGLGHMIYVWNACQERNTYTLSERDLAVISGIEHFASTLVEVGLGRKVKGGRIEIKGTRGRIEWLAKARNNGTKGGRPAKPSGLSKGLTTGLPSGSAENNPPAPALTLESKDTSYPSDAPPEDPATLVVQKKQPRKLSDHQLRVKQVEDAWREYDTTHPPEPPLIAKWISEYGLASVLQAIHDLGKKNGLKEKGGAYLIAMLENRAKEARAPTQQQQIPETVRLLADFDRKRKETHGTDEQAASS